ncbi:DUF3499 domain-containing protein [Knoellia aerolata]|uniref:DUF3499 domain-containing protein n=1 Tax=Knoellia aerolata DSM 18566 TaxID=1385519 RepID=A0A0A0JZ73_9MICO|nr:DUF3499 domain-containing protein [Knoellia aerolata]KGN40851.1 hypothetical protein N801_10720 [Knoellia aerolata DSM 18566]
MNASRKCTKTACAQLAVATLTYAYADRAAVLGPLATYAEPHSYDLCSEHAIRLTVPQGWEVVRLEGDGYEPAPEYDDLVAVVEAVREVRDIHPPQPTVARAAVSAMPLPGEQRRGHLRVLPGLGEA